MPGPQQTTFGPFRLDPANACLWRKSEVIALMPKAFAVLEYLVQHPGRLVTKDALLEGVWPGTAVGEAVLKVCIGEIRKALRDPARTPRFIATVHRRGYRFIAPVTAVTASDTAQAPGGGLRPAPVQLAGREIVLDALHRGLARALGGERQVVFVTGEPGIGKTSVVEAFVSQLATDPQRWIAQGQCMEHYGKGEAYLPVLDALGRMCSAPGGARLLALLRRHAPTWLVQLPGLLSAGERKGLQRELLGATQERMLREMAEAVEVLTAEIPLVLVLEDLHWSDYGTLDLLARLARRREPAHLLLIATYRPVEVILSDHPLKAVKADLELHGQCRELPLDVLGEAAVSAYLADRFPGSPLPVELAPLIHQRTDGLPLFMVTVVDELMAQGVLVERDGRWALPGGLEAIRMAMP